MAPISNAPPPSSSFTTASQAWAMLRRHARDDFLSTTIRLQELLSDKDRIGSLVVVHSVDERMLVVDFSRQKVTLETMNHLLRLAASRGLLQFRHELAWGTHTNTANGNTIYGNSAPTHPRNHKPVEPTQPDVSSVSYHPSESHTPMYMALRAPRKSQMYWNGQNVCSGITKEWDRIQRLSESVRRGQLRGITGQVLKDVVVVGSGVPTEALLFLYEALVRDGICNRAAKDGLAELMTRRTFTTTTIPVGHRRMRFVTSPDPIEVSKAIQDLDAGSTLVISLALTGHEETGLASRVLKDWLWKSLGNASRKMELVFSKHMLLVTGNDRIFEASKPESVFLIPSHSRCEPFSSLTAMTLLPLSIVFGWTITQQVIQGAHNLDVHFVETNPRHNLPILLALMDVWNDAFLETPGRVVDCYSKALSGYGSFVTAIESQVCGAPSDAAFPDKTSCGVVLSGGNYNRMQFQGSMMLPTEFVTALDVPRTPGLETTPEPLRNHDAVLCSLFANADELAESGNRPSTLLLCGALDAFTCGQLIALAEHRSCLKAKLWNMDPFVVHGPSATARTDRLKQDFERYLERVGIAGNDEEEDEIRGVNFSTSTLLANYASRTKDQRAYVDGNT